MPPSGSAPPRSRPAPRHGRLRRAAPYLVAIAVALVGGAGFLAAAGRLGSCGGVLEGADTGIRKALAARDRLRLDAVADGASAELRGVRFGDVASEVEGNRATVTAMVSAEGRVAWRDGAAALAYVGRERFGMRRCASGWCADGDELNRLRGVLGALLGHHDGASSRPARVVGWQIRIERFTAEVGEDSEIATVGAAPRPERHLYRLELRGDRWIFTGGV